MSWTTEHEIAWNDTNPFRKFLGVEVRFVDGGVAEVTLPVHDQRRGVEVGGAIVRRRVLEHGLLLGRPEPAEARHLVGVVGADLRVPVVHRCVRDQRLEGMRLA